MLRTLNRAQGSMSTNIALKRLSTVAMLASPGLCDAVPVCFGGWGMSTCVCVF